MPIGCAMYGVVIWVLAHYVLVIYILSHYTLINEETSFIMYDGFVLLRL